MKVVKIAGSCVAVLVVIAVASSIMGVAIDAQDGRAGGPGAQGGRGRNGGPTAPAPAAGPSTVWPTYGGNLASHRYSPADQITKDNFSKLEIAWRLKTDFLGPRPDTLYSATHSSSTGCCTRRRACDAPVIALNAATGEMLWMHTEDEGVRGQNAPRQGAGRGVAYWASGTDRRVIYVTPGYRMKALDAKTGIPVPGFGKNGVVDLKLEMDQDVDLDTAELGLNATPLVVGDVIVVGAAHRPGGSPRTMRNAKGRARLRRSHGKRLWIFHTIPQRGEFGYDTWLEGSAEYNGNTGVWAQMSGDAELGLVYVPVEMPTGDYYGGNREQPLRRQPRCARRQDREAQVALPDGSPRRLGLGPGMRANPVRHEHERPHRQGDRAADEAGVSLRVQSRDGEPIWPIEERPCRNRTCRRTHQPDAAVPDKAGALRLAGHHRERPARPDAGVEGRASKWPSATRWDRSSRRRW